MTTAATFEIEYLQFLTPDGTLSRPLPPAVPEPAALLPLFRQMLFLRTFDSKAIAWTLLKLASVCGTLLSNKLK